MKYSGGNVLFPCNSHERLDRGAGKEQKDEQQLMEKFYQTFSDSPGTVQTCPLTFFVHHRLQGTLIHEYGGSDQVKHHHRH